MENLDEKIREEAEARVSFKRHLQVYIAVNILTWSFWVITRAQYGHYDGYWPVYSTLGWGFGVLMHYFGVYHRDNNAVEKEIEKIKQERGMN